MISHSRLGTSDSSFTQAFFRRKFEIREYLADTTSDGIRELDPMEEKLCMRTARRGSPRNRPRSSSSHRQRIAARPRWLSAAKLPAGYEETPQAKAGDKFPQRLRQVAATWKDSHLAHRGRERWDCGGSRSWSGHPFYAGKV
jgi:hypothetical protein